MFTSFKHAKGHLLSTAAAVTMLLAAMPLTQAHAGSYSDESARMMNDTRRIQPEAPSSQQHTSIPQEADQVSRIEPAAGQNVNPYDDFTGIYGGGEVGYGFTDDVDGWNGGLFLGYGFEHKFDMLGAYIGMEIGYEWSDGDGDTAGLSFEKDHAWIATLRPGFTVMGDGLGYGIVGYSRAEFESGGDDEYLDGLVLGLGTQFNTGTAFKPRLEYTYTNYEDATIGGTSFAATENTVKLGVVFQF